ncbi:putative parvulin-type peptidyl-prolyl cis-trans isomerase [Ralstonia psammae]|uniref:peptidylprolyl isomerase n=1 Tax=Ralstonia psammae TaxID=3058598 RepID=A0ABM9JZ81_9RALS|nr:peptidyl-prolyl cis-trans isomerase [Ralstonia sp. LMG 19083]CAJ0809150.1 putative parvulin-type peptidyl-prolyl cis-trans isomerase [Ralstonia sp. LMG 19083]
MKTTREWIFVAVLVSAAVGAALLQAGDALSEPVQRAAISAPMTASAAAGNGAAAAVVQINGVPLARSTLEQAVAASGQPDTPALRAAVQERLVTRELLRQAAVAAKLGDAPEVQRAVEQVRVDTQIRLYLERELHPAPVNDAQVRERYDASVAELGPVEYKPSLIGVVDEAHAREVMAMLKTGVPFDVVARQKSLAPSRGVGGELPWVSFRTPLREGHTMGLVLPLAQLLTTMKVGEVAQLPVRDGIAVVRLDAKRPTYVVPFDVAQGLARQELQTQERNAALASLVRRLRDQAVLTQ